MKIKKRLIIGLISFVIFHPSAWAVNGKSVLEICETANKQEDKNLKLVCKTAIIVSLESYKIAKNEVIEDLSLFEVIPTEYSAKQLKDAMKGYCLGENIDGNAITAIVIEHLRKNPRQHELHISKVAVSALSRAFPCKNNL